MLQMSSPQSNQTGVPWDARYPTDWPVRTFRDVHMNLHKVSMNDLRPHEKGVPTHSITPGAAGGHCVLGALRDRGGSLRSTPDVHAHVIHPVQSLVTVKDTLHDSNA